MPKILEFSENPNSDYCQNMYKFGLRVNAGDAAAILYESPYSNRYTLWLEKTKRIPRPPQTDAMRSGIVTEPLIMEWYQKHKGIVGWSQAWGIHDEFNWIQGKADFWAPDMRLLAEFKAPTRDGTKDHESAKAGVVPRHYFLQCQHLLEVYDVEQMDYVSWRSADDFALLTVKRDIELWLLTMLPAYQEFWEALQTDKFPKPEGVDEQVSERRRMLGRQWLDCREMHRECELKEQSIKGELQRDQGAAKVIVGGGIRTSVVSVGPRWTVSIACASADAAQQVLAAVKPLEGKSVLRPSTDKAPNPKLSAVAPSLQFRVTAQGEQED